MTTTQRRKISPSPFKIDGRREVVYVDPKKLVPAAFNPPSRTAPKALKALRANIEQHGILVPLLVSRSMRIGAGHRRHQIALELGLKQVPVIFFDNSLNSLAELWGAEGRSTKSMNGKEWFHMWFYSTPSCDLKSKLVPVGVMTKIRLCWEVFETKANVKKIIDDGFSPFAGQRAKEIFLRLEQHSPTRGQITSQDIGRWILKYGKPGLEGIDFLYRWNTARSREMLLKAVAANKLMTVSECRIKLTPAPSTVAE